MFAITLFLIASALATDNVSLEVYEEVLISGIGTIDIDRMAQSSPTFTGQKLFETLLPTYPHVNSASLYYSNLELILSDNSTIFYEQDLNTPYSKHYLKNENFVLGTCAAYYFKGPHLLNASFESTPYLSEAIVFSEVQGRTVLSSRVVNLSKPHFRTHNSRIWLEGKYSADWNFLVIHPEIPEAGESDYLGCP
ncbi:MAG: hypothetical protein IMF19_16925 [Proteobacteria bacterium]|nr:hypothetical protein [Pseudomonadota bacterium]